MTAQAALCADALALHSQLWRMPEGSTRSLAPMPVTISRSEMSLLRGWLAAPKNDGVRASFLLGAHETTDVPYVAILTRHGGGALTARCAASPLLEDPEKKVEAPGFAARVLCRDLFNGTLLDGEKVKSTFVAFDAVSVCGYDVRGLPFRVRCALATAVCAAIKEGGARDAVEHVRSKQWVRTDRLDELVAAANVEQQGAFDGIVFADPEAPMKAGRSDRLVKWKPTRLHTLDFRYKAGQWWFGSNAIEKNVAEKGLDVEAGDLTLEENGIYEAAPLSRTRFRAIARREDKDAPNNEVCVDGTLVNVAEDVSLEELVREVGASPQAKRQKKGT